MLSIYSSLMKLPLGAIRIGGCYKVEKYLGGGSYSDVYSGQETSGHVKTNVVIKVAKSRSDAIALLHEHQVLRYLEGNSGIPKALWMGREGELHIMVLERLGPSLDDRFRECCRKFSLNTVTLIAAQLLSRLQDVHLHHYIHCDIKPANILSGTTDCPNMLYLADFGIAKQYRHPHTHIHIPFRNDVPLTGTPAFSSINSHIGAELSRRDDIESLGYVLIYFLRGSLPWLGVDNMDAVLQLKQGISVDDLCSGLPRGFKLILEHARALAFTQRPDYELLQSYVQQMRAALPDPDDVIFDWQCSCPCTPLPIASVTSSKRSRSHK